MYLLFDIGATNMRLALARHGQIVKCVKAVTPQGYKAGLAQFAALVREFKTTSITAAAGGLPGRINPDHTAFSGMAHLPLWVGKPVQKDFEKILHVPVFLENDAALAGFGESVFGAGRGKNIIAYIGVGTGIGGTRIVNKKIDANAFGFEPGHHIMQAGALSKKPRTWEYFVSGSGIKKRFGMPAEKLKYKATWENIAYHLACGLVNAICFWSPDVVVLGGSVVTKGPVDVRSIAKHVEELLPGYQKFPEIKKVKLGDQSGLFGALALLQARSR